MNTNDEILKLTAERDALREALEEVCRCVGCGGTGLIWVPVGYNRNVNERCPDCNGTGSDYHGSEKARALLDAKQ